MLRTIRWLRLSPLATKRKRPNRRAHSRRNCRGLQVQLFLEGQLCRATPYDLSAGGVGVVVPHRLEPGTLVGVELKDRRGSVWVKRLRVTHATPQAGGCWLVGGRFLKPRIKAS